MSDATEKKQVLEELLAARFPAQEAKPEAGIGAATGAVTGADWRPASFSLTEEDDADVSDDEIAWFQRLSIRHYLAGGACFLAGAVFWNLVGVWQVVSGIVEHTPQEKALMQRVFTPTKEIKLVGDDLDVRAVAREEAKSCTQLILDRTSGVVSSKSCDVVFRGQQSAEPVVEQPVGQTAIRRNAE